MPAYELRHAQTTVGEQDVRDDLAQQLEPRVGRAAPLAQELLDDSDVAVGVADGRGEPAFELASRVTDGRRERQRRIHERLRRPPRERAQRARPELRSG